MRSNRTDESIATIAALAITLIIGIFMLFIVSKCEMRADHGLKSDRYGQERLL